MLLGNKIRVGSLFFSMFVRVLCSIPGLGRFPGEGNGCPLQYSCLENSMDRGAWRATVPMVAKSQTQLSDFHILKSLQSCLTL